MDMGSWGFQYASKKNTMPFEEIREKSVKIKSIPIQLNWAGHGGTAVPVKMPVVSGSHQAGTEDSSSCGVEPTSQKWWFRSPPAVQEVAGILGHGPYDETRGGNPECSEQELGDDPESGYRTTSLSFPWVKSISCKSLSQSANPKQTNPPNALHKFVGHLWRQSTSRSFVATIRADLAPMVGVKMNREGHQGNFGAARDGFGSGRQGKGGGRTFGRNLTWD